MNQAQHEDLKRRGDAFVKRADYPQALRRNAARRYHPDLNPPELKELCTEIMALINAKCDELEKKQGK